MSNEMSSDYAAFLRGKKVSAREAGFDLPLEAIHSRLFDWQREIVRWALRLGRAALFEECGLGKTLQQLEWARHVAAHTGGRVLILAPLAVAHQTVREAAKIELPIRYVRSAEDVERAVERVFVANYEMLEHFDPAAFAGIVLDESSILKSFMGKTKRKLLEYFEATPFRLACTATPAPNDHLELGNHADFLGVMPSNEMIARWFINDSMSAGSYRLKRHAEADFWRWLTSWAVCVSIPSDLGYSDDGFVLPPLEIREHRVAVDHSRAYREGKLFVDVRQSATSMWGEKRTTMKDRVATAVAIIMAEADEPWVAWVETNAEADAMLAALPAGTLDIRGAHSIAVKEDSLERFVSGASRILVSKPDICGWGLNWQHCARQVFVGITYSFERCYQALRRSWRFGQTRTVQAHTIYAESEGTIMQTLRAKQAAHREMQERMTDAMRSSGLSLRTDLRPAIDIERDVARGKNWTLHLGDCVETTREIESDSVDFTVFSPPFSTLYIYSNSIADMGNSADHREFFEHYDFLAPELFRVTRPGRLCAIHCKDLPLYRGRDGAAGLYDFPGDLRASMERAGWTYHSRITIWKDPVIEMQRTKNHGLLWRNFTERGEVCRQGMADYLLVFRKWVETDAMPDRQIQHRPVPGDYIGSNPPEHWDSDRDYSIQLWQKYASPVWGDIRQTNVLNVEQARESQDEKHLCPLQLDVIERAIWLWSNPGEVVFSPFAGIGSEGFVALKMDRRFIGVELKRSYWETARKTLTTSEKAGRQGSLFVVKPSVESPRQTMATE